MPAAPNLPTLTLSAPLLTTLQPATYLTHHLERTNTRPTNGRSPHDPRSFSCTTSSLSHCAGSSLVRLGDTAVVCGIQAEQLLRASVPDPPREHLVPARNKSEELAREQDDIASLSLLVLNVELNAGAAPTLVAGEGRAPGQLQQSLSVRLLRLLLSSRMVRLEDLLIRRGGDAETAAAEKERMVGYWVLYITLLPLSVDGTASLFDALWTALLAALQDVRLPEAWWAADHERLVCSDAAAETHGLQLRCRPVATTFGVFIPGPHIWSARADDEEPPDEIRGSEQRWILADPDGFEDRVCEECVTIVVGGGKNSMRIFDMEKSGGSAVGAAGLAKLTEIAEERWRKVMAMMPSD